MTIHQIMQNYTSEKLNRFYYYVHFLEYLHTYNNTHQHHHWIIITFDIFILIIIIAVESNTILNRSTSVFYKLGV